MRPLGVTEVAEGDTLIDSLAHTLNLVIEVLTKMRAYHHTPMRRALFSHYTVMLCVCTGLCVGMMCLRVRAYART